MCYQVGAEWLANTSPFTLPDGSTTSDRDFFKNAWVHTGQDSLFRTLEMARGNYDSGYDLPQPPPPPDLFEVMSGVDRITLTWSYAGGIPAEVAGFKLFRAIDSPDTTFDEIFACGAGTGNPVLETQFIDDTAIRGVDCYYYIVAFDAGTTYDDQSVVRLTSSKFWTRTIEGAYLRHGVTVYPGDTDNNGVVEALDILPIGINFLRAGFPRDSLQVSWSPKIAPSWNSLPATYADANGDGVIDEKDVIAIGVNWGNTHQAAQASYGIDPANRELLAKYRASFHRIYGSLSGESEANRSMRALLRTVLDIQVPREFVLHQNYPNPFNPRTSIRFDLPEDRYVTLSIYNVRGQVVRVLLDQVLYPAGLHSIELAGSGLSSGIYLYRFQAGTWSATRKMAVLR
jgi:hypothetical protein